MPNTTSQYTDQSIQEGKALWERCYTLLRELISAEDLKRWIEPIKPRAYVAEEKIFVLVAPSELFVTYLEEHYAEAFNKIMLCFLPADSSLIFEYVDSSSLLPPAQGAVPTASAKAEPLDPTHYMSHLNEHLSFENYYESESNRLARMVAESVAKTPGQAPLNLLFLYGHSGVGKTHLVQAIGQRVRLLHPELKVCYVSAGKFAMQYAHDARFRDKATFIRFYQQMDVLIIDDVQNFISMEKTQQAFFEIFNHLTLLNKQIILTCDVQPSEMGGMEERLQTRIMSSMALELKRPDRELRRKILEDRLRRNGVQVSEEVIEHVVDSVQGNVREVEGIAKSLWLKSYETQRPIDMSEVHTVVSHTISITQREVTMEDIQQLVAQEYGVDIVRFKEATRKAEIVLPRHLVMYLTAQHTKLSQKAIAERLHRKNHTTVIHGIKAIKDRMETSDDFRKHVATLEGRLFAPV